MKLAAVGADVAASRNKNLNTVLDQLSDAIMKKDLKALAKWGVAVDTNATFADQLAQATEQMNEQFGGSAAANADTYATRLAVLGQKFGDMQEKIGELLIPIILKLVNITMPIIDTLIGAFDNLKSSFDFSAIWTILKDVFDGIMGGVKALWGSFKLLGGFIKPLISRLMPTMIKLFDRLKKKWDIIVKALTSPVAKAAFAAISASIGTTVTVIVGLFDIFDAVFTGILDFAITWVEEYINLLSAGWDVIKSIFSGGFDEAWDNFTQTGEDAFDNLMTIASDTGDSVVTAMSTMGTNIVDSVKDGVDGVVDSYKEGADEIREDADGNPIEIPVDVKVSDTGIKAVTAKIIESTITSVKSLQAFFETNKLFSESLVQDIMKSSDEGLSHSEAITNRLILQAQKILDKEKAAADKKAGIRLKDLEGADRTAEAMAQITRDRNEEILKADQKFNKTKDGLNQQRLQVELLQAQTAGDEMNALILSQKLQENAIKATLDTGNLLSQEQINEALLELQATQGEARRDLAWAQAQEQWDGIVGITTEATNILNELGANFSLQELEKANRIVKGIDSIRGAIGKLTKTQGVFNKISKAGEGIVKGLGTALKGMAKGFASATAEIWSNIKAGIVWLAQQAVVVAKAIAGAAISAAKAVAGIPFIGPALAVAAAAAVVGGLSYLLGFDDPENDKAATRWGKDAGKHFLEGFHGELGAPRFGEAAVGALASASSSGGGTSGPISQIINVIIEGSAGDQEFIEQILAPQIEQAAFDGMTRIMVAPSRMTGGPSESFGSIKSRIITGNGNIPAERSFA